jgi:hypothetical protein
MKVLWNLLAFLVAAIASLACALYGAGTFAGPDIGFAGAGLWFLMVPVAFVGLLGGLACVGFKTWSGDPFLRRLVFVIASAVLSFAVGAGGAKALLSSWGSEPEIVYVPSPLYSATIEIAAPAEVAAGEPFRVHAQYKGGPWERVRYEDLKLERYRSVASLNRPAPLPPVLGCVESAMFWETEPWLPSGGLLMGDRRRGGDCTFTLSTPGKYKFWVRVTSPVEAKSNELNLTVRAK